RVACDVDPEDRGLALVGAQGRRQHPHGRGLAGAVGSEQSEHRARGDVEVDPVERHDVAEALAEAFDRDGRDEVSIGHASTLAESLNTVKCRMSQMIEKAGVNRRTGVRSRAMAESKRHASQAALAAEVWRA